MASLDVSGYVLAGGRSSRMGRDKALLELGGRPLVEWAVAKLRRICGEVSVLSGDAALGVFAPVVGDLHAGCGPLGGIEAALAHSTREWCLIVPVDVPFLPVGVLDRWARATIVEGARLAMFVVDGRPQPAVLMIHREMLGYVTGALGRGEYRLLPALAGAAGEIATFRDTDVDKVFSRWQWEESSGGSASVAFANLNTPEEFAEAAKHLLDASGAEWTSDRLSAGEGDG